MKKSLIALAVAGVFTAPVYAASGNVDVYGVMSFSVDWVDTNETNGDSSDINTGVDNVSRIGFKGTEDLGGGLKAVWQIEAQLNANKNEKFTTTITTPGGTTTISLTAAQTSLRNTFVGLSGGFGTVLLGRHDTPYKLATGKLDPMADTIGDYNAIVGRTPGGNLFDLRPVHTIIYTTPNFSGFSGAIGYVEGKINEFVAAGVATDNTTAWSVMGMYDNGPFFASLAYEVHSGDYGFGAVQGAAGAPPVPPDDINAWKLGLGYKFGDTQLGLVYEEISDGDTNGANAFGKPNEREAWYISAAHTMGPIKLSLAYGNADDSKRAAVSNDGADFWAIGADYALSNRTSLYARYATVQNDGDLRAGGGRGYSLNNYTRATSSSGGNTWANDIDAFSVGIKHSF